MFASQRFGSAKVRDCNPEFFREGELEPDANAAVIVSERWPQIIRDYTEAGVRVLVFEEMARDAAIKQAQAPVLSPAAVPQRAPRKSNGRRRKPRR